MKYIILLLLSFGAIADTATITFIAPTEREDKSPLSASEIAGFTVHDSVGVEIMQLLPSVREFTIPTTSVTQSLFITTVDTDGRVSVYSQEATIPATVANPKPPTGITVTVAP